ncbi:MAG: M28 family peptidase [Terriglobales bacterium]
MTMAGDGKRGRLGAGIFHGARVPGGRLAWALLLIGLTACAGEKKAVPPSGAATEQPAAAARSVAAPLQPEAAPAEAPRINSERALRYVRQVVALGPRPPGSLAHGRLQAFLRSELKRDAWEEDAFVAETPEGKIPMRNLIARFPGTKEGVIVIATHYDTNLPLKNFVGANDGGSGTGLLLELANQLRGKKRAGYSVWLVWLDGEEAVRQWSASDGLYGSRHLAERWQKDGTLKKIKAFLLADMVGDADLNLDRDTNSTPWLLDLVKTAATSLGYQSHFYRRSITIEDDHLPFARAGVPVADLIDFDYGYNNVFHHTSEDTLDKLSPRSLEIAGNVLLETVRLLDAR